MELAEYMVNQIKAQSDKYHLILEPELVNVSFWYIPPRLRGIPHSPSKEQDLGKVYIVSYSKFLSPKYKLILI